MTLLVDITELYKFIQLVKHYNEDLIPKWWDVISSILHEETFVRSGPYMEIKGFGGANQFVHKINSPNTCKWLCNNLPNQLVEAISLWDIAHHFTAVKC